MHYFNLLYLPVAAFMTVYGYHTKDGIWLGFGIIGVLTMTREVYEYRTTPDRDPAWSVGGDGE